jgi:hypothetical protein
LAAITGEPSLLVASPGNNASPLAINHRRRETPHTDSYGPI